MATPKTKSNGFFEALGILAFALALVFGLPWIAAKINTVSDDSPICYFERKTEYATVKDHLPVYKKVFVDCDEVK